MTLTPTGLISGAATSLGTFSFTVLGTDSCPAGAQSAQKAFSLSVIPFSLSLTLSASSVNIPSGSATTQNIGYTISAVPPTDITLQSSQGNFLAGSTLIEQVNTPLTISVINGIGRTAEILNIPVSVTKRAKELGVSNITYERTFTNGAVSENAQVFITLTTEAAAELKIQRLQLYFENRRAEITVKRNDLKLKSYADIRYTGTGLLEGFWEVDGRLLSQVKKHIVYGTSITIETPASPPIPTFETGTHRLRFVITSPAAVSPLPESIYFVAEEKFEKRVFPVRLVFPLNNSVIAFSPATFRWEGIDGAVVYIIEFFEEGKEKPAFSAYMKRAEYSLPPPALKTIFFEGRAYRWRVKVFDKNRNMAGESSLNRFRFR
jgi:hypothetical protein